MTSIGYGRGYFVVLAKNLHQTTKVNHKIKSGWLISELELEANT